jgi:diguanylate cyclase (GGDEF)-like protein/PAS domain S-box-containing protein
VKNRGWILYLVLGLAASLVAGASPSGAAVGPLTQIVGWLAVIIGVSTAKKSSPEAGRPWAFFVAAASAFLIAGLVRTIHGSIIDFDRPFPSPADAIALAGHVCLIIGGVLLGHLRSPDRDRAVFIDGAIIAVALQTVVWSWLLYPYMTDPSIPVAERAINGAYAVMTTFLLSIIGRLAVGPGARTTSYRLLAAAVITIFVQDVLVTVETVGGPQAWVGRALAPPIFVLFGAAALHPARQRIAEATSRTDGRLPRRRIVVLTVALLVNPAIIVLQLRMGDDISVAVAVGSTIILVLLVMFRFFLLARTQERTVELQRVLQEANADLAAASSRHAMHRATLRAVVRLANDLPGLRVSIAQAAGSSLRVLDSIGQDAESAVGTSIAMDAVPDALVDGLASLTPTSVDAAAPIDLSATQAGGGTASVLVAPLSAQHDLSGALILTSRRPIDSTLRQSVETLASTVSLALESAVLTENLLRRRSERRFRALVEHSSDIVLVVNADRQITFASPAAHRLLGLSEKSLLGSHPARWVHADDWPVLARVLEGTPAVGHQESDGVEVRLVHVDGSHRWFEIRTRDLAHDPEIQGLVVTAREVSDRKATEQQLAASEARFRALVQSSSDVVAVVGENGCFTYISPAVSEMLGYAPEELTGSPAIALVAPEDVETFQASYPELSQRRWPVGDLTIRRVETQLRHRSGELRTVDITVTDMRGEPAVGGIVLNARDITVRKALEADLRFQALHDTLTGLANRTMFTQQTAAALRGGKGIESVGALFIDLDDFKTVNDSLGHAVGDQLLQEVSARLVTSLSSEDVAARLGGDEFAVLVVDAADQAGVVALAERVLGLVAQPYRIQGRDIRVTASIGIAFADEEGVDAEVLLRSADVAMYLAKDRGKNRYAVFEAHMHTSVFERLELKADLVRAIDDGQLRCHYQPIVSLQTGRITGVEALVRWEHPTRGFLYPDAFIPLAEDTGLVVPLGRWVMHEACQQLRAWQLRLPARSTLTMSINLSVRQLMHEQIIDEVRESIEDAGLDPSTVTLEITETTLMHDTEMTRDRLAELRNIGVSLAVDDFGTGYSSLQYVQRFPIDVIKIDRSFVTGLGTNPGDGAVVQSMIELSQRLGVHTVAEGIDRPEQVTLLQSLGADLGQGYLFSKPVSADQISALLDSSPHENPRFQLH